MSAGKVFKRYWRHASLAVQETVAYRAGYIINVLASFIAYVVIFFVWNAVYAGRPAVGDFSWDDMKAYLLIALFTSAFISGYSEFRIARQVRTGDVVVQLLRPVSFQVTNLAATLGNSLTEGTLVGILLIVAVVLFGSVPTPTDAVGWIAFAASLPLSYLTKYLVLYIFSLFVFWTNSYMGLNWLRRGLTDFFSGALIPIAFFPDALAAVANALPFRGIVALPAAIWLGHLKGQELVVALLVQLAWVVALWWLARGIWALAMRKVTIQGG